MLGMRVAAHAVGLEQGPITMALNDLTLEPVLPRYCLPSFPPACTEQMQLVPLSWIACLPGHIHTHQLQPVPCANPLDCDRCRS